MIVLSGQASYQLLISPKMLPLGSESSLSYITACSYLMCWEWLLGDFLMLSGEGFLLFSSFCSVQPRPIKCQEEALKWNIHLGWERTGEQPRQLSVKLLPKKIKNKMIWHKNHLPVISDAPNVLQEVLEAEDSPSPGWCPCWGQSGLGSTSQKMIHVLITSSIQQQLNAWLNMNNSNICIKIYSPTDLWPYWGWVWAISRPKKLWLFPSIWTCHKTQKYSWQTKTLMGGW